MEINMEKNKENLEKIYDILFEANLSDICNTENYEIVFFKEIEILPQLPEISEIIDKLDFKEISIVNLEDKIIITIFSDISNIQKYLIDYGFSIGIYFIGLTDKEYSKITSKYIDKKTILTKSYYVIKE